MQDERIHRKLGIINRANRERFVQRFPACFADKDGDFQPLAIGIDKQLREAMPELLDCSLVYFLSWYTRQPRYLRASAEPGARRVNLDGSDAGPVSEADRDHAQRQLEQMARLAAVKPVSKKEDGQRHAPAPLARHPMGPQLSLKARAS